MTMPPAYNPSGAGTTPSETGGPAIPQIPAGRLTAAALDPSIAGRTVPGTAAPASATTNPQLLHLASLVALYQDLHAAAQAGRGAGATQPQTVPGPHSGVPVVGVIQKWAPFRATVGTEPTPGARQAQQAEAQSESKAATSTPLAEIIQEVDPSNKNPGKLAADIEAGKASTAELQGLGQNVYEAIFRQVGEYVPGRSQTDPAQLLQLPIGNAAAQLGLRPGITIGAAVNNVPTTGAGRATAGGGSLTAQDLYAKFVDDWNTSPAYQKAMTNELFSAGFLGTTHPSAAQVSDAYKSVITDAVSGTNPESTTAVLSAATAAAQSPALRRGENETNYQAIIKQSAETYGVNLNDNQVNAIAAQAEAQKWDPTHIDQVVRQSYSPTNAPATGVAGEIASNIQTQAADYLVPLSPQDLQKYVGQYLTEGLSAASAGDSFKQYAQQLATGLYPTLAPQIQSGLSTKTLLTPYASQASKTLGIDPETIDWTSPKWQAALSGGRDAKGAPTLMDLNQFTNYLRQNPAFDWKSTQEAQDAYASTANMILKTFGAASTSGM
jgi:hypothetical protein